jgi:putative membrane protein insertion efficiency factor
MPFYQKLKRILLRIPNYVALGIISIYRWLFSPTVGFLRHIPGYPKQTCIYYPTCSEYGLECFKKYPFYKAFYKTINRIGRCHPGNEPGVDLP